MSCAVSAVALFSWWRTARERAREKEESEISRRSLCRWYEERLHSERRRCEDRIAAERDVPSLKRLQERAASLQDAIPNARSHHAVHGQ